MSDLTLQAEAGPQSISVRVTAIRYAAKDINIYEFTDMGGDALPAMSAGAHIDVVLPVGTRQYSLVADQAAEGRYAVAVKLDRNSRDGSRYMHEKLRVGDILRVSPPRNHFELFEPALHTVLIAGGIGITPIWSMLQRLVKLGRQVELYYACRTRDEMAFFDELSARPNTHLHLDDAHGRPLDIAGIVTAAPSDAHLYCCGPLPMLDAFVVATKGVDQSQVHVEYFQPKEAAALDGGYVVELAKSGLELPVPAGKTILDVVEEAGIQVDFSCGEGICGTCETRVLAGTPTIVTPS